MYYVYIIKCGDDSLYTGMTDNLERRFEEHITQKGGHYTKYSKAIAVIYSEKFLDKHEAAQREKQIKGWTRAKKLALAKGEKALLKQL